MKTLQGISRSNYSPTPLPYASKGGNTEERSVTAVSNDRSVQGEQLGRRDKVAGSSSSRRANLGQYRSLLDGHQLPPMTQLLGGGQGRITEEVPQSAQDQLESRSPSQSQDSQEAQIEGAPTTPDSSRESEAQDSNKTTSQSSEEPKKSMTGKELTREEVQQVEELKARDREVRNHEQAHVAAGGQYVRGGISYDYQKGPDGRNYAVGGHVNIDVSEANTPEATIVKMQQVKRAALAPAEPSGADRAVAATAAQKEQQARGEILKERQEEAVKRRSEVSKSGPSRDAKTEKSTATGSTENTERPEVTQSAEAAQAPQAPQASQISAQSEKSEELPRVEAPQPKNHMSLAREARMRIKRGITWLA